MYICMCVRVRDEWCIHCDTCPHSCISNNNSNIDGVLLDAEHTKHGPPGAASYSYATTAAPGCCSLAHAFTYLPAAAAAAALNICIYV